MSQTKVAVGMLNATGTPGSRNFLRGDGSWQTAGGGKLGQVVTTTTASTSTNSTTIPADDSIPQNDEGDEILTLAITPANASSKLMIFVTIGTWYNSASAQTKVAALFKDSDANAIFSIADSTNDDYAKVCDFHWTQTAGSTSSQTFKLRVGSSSGNVVVNYASIYGGANQVVMSIWEIEP